MMSFVLEHIVWVTLLTLLAALVCYCLRPSPQTRYTIWLLLLAKLLIAPIFFWPVAIEDFWPSQFTTNTDNVAGNVANENTNYFSDVAAVGNSGITKPENVSGTEPAKFESYAAWIPKIVMVLAGCWLIGILVRITTYATRLAQFFKGEKTCVPPSEPLIRTVQKMSSKSGIKTPRIVIVSGIQSPAVIWFGRTCLLWPKFEDQGVIDAKQQERRELWLAHELAHLRRYDHFLGWMETIALIVWWWLPVTYWIVRELQLACETCCDHWVKKMAPNKVSRYAHLLVDSAGRHQHSPVSELYAGFWSNKSALTYRLKSLLDNGVSRWRFLPMWIGCIGLIALPHMPVFSSTKRIHEKEKSAQTSVTKTQADFVAHMKYLVQDGGAWRATNPDFKPNAGQPKTFRYEFSWGTNKSIVKGKIIGEYANGDETTYSEMIVFWHPETKDMTLHQYGSSGEIGKGTTEHLANGNERIVYSIVDRSGSHSHFEYLNERQSSSRFVTHRKMKPANGEWQQLPKLTWERIKK